MSIPVPPALPTWADVVAIAVGAAGVSPAGIVGDAAAFDAMPTATKEAILDEAIALCNPISWAEKRNFGIVYLAAHLAKLGLLRGGGFVTQEAVGQESRGYAFPIGIKGSLGLTAYGLEYKRLIKLLPTALGAVF